MIGTPNDLNRLYYSCCPDARGDSSSLANFFCDCEEVNAAMVKVILESYKSRDLRIKELCFGTRIPKRYRSLPYGSVVMSDFDDSWLPIGEAKKLGKVNFEIEKQSLLEEFPKLPENKRCDVVIVAYGFDSVWQKEDVRYEKKGDDWFRVDLEVVFPEDFPFESKDISIDCFKRIKILKKKIKIEILGENYGEVIKNGYQSIESVALNFPGGMIKKVEELFDRQLKTGGMVLIGETGVADQAAKLAYTNKWANAYDRSGRVAIFKTEDLGIASEILRQKDYQVYLKRVPDFLLDYKEDLVPFGEDQWMMVVTK